MILFHTNSNATFLIIVFQLYSYYISGLIDKNPNPELPSDEYYFQSHNSIGVRRIRSTALETSCPAPSLTVHPNSLEIIGCKSRNPLPPPR